VALWNGSEVERRGVFFGVLEEEKEPKWFMFVLRQKRRKAMDRYEKGVERFKEIKGENGEGAIERLKELDPDLARYVIEFPFGDIYSRPGLDLRSREIATISALIALGNAPIQLGVHIRSALNVGVTRQEIKEIIIQMAVYAGFPAALNAMRTAKEVFEELDREDKKEVETPEPKKLIPHLVK
jgi:4-carboxymuconolactone decarboxylase